MRITILTVGTRGDVQPFVALGRGLECAGHSVTLATHPIFEGLVRQGGLEFRPLEGNPKAILLGTAGQDMLGGGRPSAGFLKKAVRAFEPVLERLALDAMTACSGTEAIIFTPWSFFGYDLAQKLSIPSVGTCLQPATPTGEFPHPAFPGRLPLGPWFNRWTHTLCEAAFWRIMEPYLNRLRTRHLAMPPVSLWKDHARRFAPIVYGFSTAVIAKPRDWGAHAHITGFWFLERDSGWAPPVELLRFLEAGPPPVCVSFGSMLPGDSAQVTRAVIGALEDAGQRGVLVTAWGGLETASAPPNVHVTAFAPFDWLLPQVSAVVHHGGAGTLAEGLRAGKPTIVCPFAGDQPFWGDVVYRLAAGPKPIPIRKLNRSNLAQAIRRAVEDSAMRPRAEQIGSEMRLEQGVGNAVAAIEQYLSVRESRGLRGEWRARRGRGQS